MRLKSRDILFFIIFGVFEYSLFASDTVKCRIFELSVNLGGETDTEGQEYYMDYDRNVLQSITSASDVRMDYHYDNNGRLLKLQRAPIDFPEQNNLNIKYNYTALGQLDHIILKNTDGGKLLDESKVKNYYDVEGRLTRQVSMIKFDNTFSKEKEYLFVYDSRKNIQKLTIKYFSQDGDVDSKEVIDYTYDNGINPGIIDPVFAVDPFYRVSLSKNNPLTITIKKYNRRNVLKNEKSVVFSYKYNYGNYPVLVRSDEGLEIIFKYLCS